MKKENRRVKYTKMVLRESLLSLLTQKPINKITVSELCDLADINRGTFYAHYIDVDDLLRKIEEELYQTISSSIEKSPRIKTNTDLLRQIFEAIYANRDLCQVIFGEYGDKDFLREVCSVQRERIIAEWEQSAHDNGKQRLGLLYAYVVNGSVGIVEQWIANEFKETPAELAKFVERLNTQGLQAFI